MHEIKLMCPKDMDCLRDTYAFSGDCFKGSTEPRMESDTDRGIIQPHCISSAQDRI